MLQIEYEDILLVSIRWSLPDFSCRRFSRHVSLFDCTPHGDGVAHCKTNMSMAARCALRASLSSLRLNRCSVPAQATQQAKMIQNGNPNRTLFSREYRPQLVITVLVGQGS